MTHAILPLLQLQVPPPPTGPSVFNTKDQVKKHEDFVSTYSVCEEVRPLCPAVFNPRRMRERLGVRTKVRGTDFLTLSGSRQWTYYSFLGSLCHRIVRDLIGHLWAATLQVYARSLSQLA